MSGDSAVKKRVWRWRRSPVKEVALSRSSSGRSRRIWVVRDVDAEMAVLLTEAERRDAATRCAELNNWLKP